jgi:hypothetical protein
MKNIDSGIKYKNNYKFNSDINSLLKENLDSDYQELATFSAAKGDHKRALEYWDLAMPPKIKNYSNEQIDSINRKYHPVQAKKYILDQSKMNKIIIINESHHIASHRVFTESLLLDLFDKGYKNLFLEALSNGDYQDTLLNKRKYPIKDSGYYITNPQFGNLIRTALKIGYTLFPYEATQNLGVEQREIDQANNIKKIIDAKPNEKFLIHCGYGHALEGNLSFFGGMALAGRLSKLTGVNPLTIDQVYYPEKSKLENSNPLLKAIKINQSSILIDDKNEPFSYKKGNGWIDIVVFHPNTEYIHNRPNWLIRDNYKFIKIDVNSLKIKFPVMVMAFEEKEDINNAVPVDLVEIPDPNDDCYLVLKKGKYQIVITNKEGNRIVFRKNVN